VRSALHRAFEDGAPTVAQPVQVLANGLAELCSHRLTPRLQFPTMW
jgi:hypothetical protein